ncbi:DUF5327 family protein [Alteribacillus sp. JSM 102045]|uniref:DUF5327 family protein n=1 Tax=Alteribacillus sp. JSM 102045 TaxID=1562101 RepID=UPI0035BFB9F5
MNISARTVVEKMEEELMRLADQVDRKEEAAVKEHARVLKSYCDILLSTDETKDRRSIERRQTADFSSQLAKPRTPVEVQEIKSAPSSQSKNEIPSTSGNLLEF